MIETPVEVSLLEQNQAWLIPFVFTMLFMVHAMVQFVLSLMVKRPPRRTKPVSAAELKARLERINKSDRVYALEPGSDWDFELQWQLVDTAWRKRFTRIRVSSVYRARLLLDEVHKEVRLQEHIRSRSFFLGLNGRIPVFRWQWSAYWGPVKGIWSGSVFGLGKGLAPQIYDVVDFRIDTDAAKTEITKIAHGCGWAVRPVILRYQISRKWQRRLQRLTPGPVLRLTDRQFWGLVYPGSYLTGFVYLFLIAGRELMEPGNLALVLGISAAWWLIWGMLTWVLLKLPDERSGRRR